MICGICNRKWPDDRCQVLRLTEEERTHAGRMTGKEAPAEYIYCGPCWKLLSNRRQGAEFIAGSMKASLRAEGHPKADLISKRTLDFLLSKSGKPVS